MQRLSEEGKSGPNHPSDISSSPRIRDFYKVPDQIRVRDKMIQLYQSGMKINHIAKKLNDDGDNKVLNPDRPDQKFYHETVKRILCDN